MYWNLRAEHARMEREWSVKLQNRTLLQAGRRDEKTIHMVLGMHVRNEDCLSVRKELVEKAIFQRRREAR